MRAALIVAILFGASRAEASPAQNSGFGPRASALAGAVSADTHDAAAVFHNPSGLAYGQGTEISFGYAATSYNLDLDGVPSNLDSVHSLEAGIVARGAIAKLPFAFAFALDLPNGHLSKVTSFRDGVPLWSLYQTTPELVDVGTVVALRPFEFLSIGGGLGFLASTRGGFHVTGTALLPDGMGSEYDSPLRHEVQADLESVRYLTFGATLVPSERMAFALAYRDEIQIEQRITGTLEGEIDATFTRIPVRYQVESVAVTGFLPRQLTLGTSFRITPELKANFDLAWRDWSEYPSPVNSSRAELDAEVPQGLMLNLPPDTAHVPPPDPGFEDRFVPRLGVEATLAMTPKFSLVLRAGYAFEKSPAPDPQPASALVDADRHVATFGTGFVWKRAARWLPTTMTFDMHAHFVSLAERRLTLQTASGPAKVSGAGSVLGAGAMLGFGFE